jgi:hypothetical protein
MFYYGIIQEFINGFVSLFKVAVRGHEGWHYRAELFAGDTFNVDSIANVATQIVQNRWIASIDSAFGIAGLNRKKESDIG